MHKAAFTSIHYFLDLKINLSKIFEKVILKKNEEIQLQSKVGLSGNSEHGLRRGRSTTCVGLTIQSLLARALDKLSRYG